MSFCGVTGRSGQFNPHSSDKVLTGRWQGPITTDRTHPVALNPHWNLTVLDRTLNTQGPVSTDRTRPVSADWTLLASGQLLFTGSRVELTGASGQHDRSVRSPRRGS